MLSDQLILSLFVRLGLYLRSSSATFSGSVAGSFLRPGHPDDASKAVLLDDTFPGSPPHPSTEVPTIGTTDGFVDVSREVHLIAAKVALVDSDPDCQIGWEPSCDRSEGTVNILNPGEYNLLQTCQAKADADVSAPFLSIFGFTKWWDGGFPGLQCWQPDGLQHRQL